MTVRFWLSWSSPCSTSVDTPLLKWSPSREGVCVCVMASLNPPRRTSVNVVSSAECRQAIGLPLITAWEQHHHLLLSLCSPSFCDFCLYRWANFTNFTLLPWYKEWQAALVCVHLSSWCLSEMLSHNLFFSFQMCDICSTMTIFSGKVPQSKSLLGFKNILNSQ